jgi:formylglycine-generating enzyme required for sulfatase activity
MLCTVRKNAASGDGSEAMTKHGDAELTAVGSAAMSARHDDMVWIPGGEFLMGSNNAYPEDAPAYRVRVDSFWMDRFTVTNAEFERFVTSDFACWCDRTRI